MALPNSGGWWMMVTAVRLIWNLWQKCMISSNIYISSHTYIHVYIIGITLHYVICVTIWWNFSFIVTKFTVTYACMYLCVCATFNVEFLQRLPKQNKKEKKRLIGPWEYLHHKIPLQYQQQQHSIVHDYLFNWPLRFLCFISIKLLPGGKKILW